MKKNVITYTRVSTEEQGKNGFSLSHQEMVIKQYCKIHDYNILLTIRGECSAKPFNRPEWQKMMTYIKTNKKAVDTILCLR